LKLNQHNSVIPNIKSRVHLTLGCAAILASLSLPTLANAGFLTSLATGDWRTLPTQHYKIEAFGYDVRVYEWTPLGNKGVRCVMTAGNKNSSGVACYPLPKSSH